ncbi:tropomyosin-like [Lytechinus pictus]|uniref:tropomyosin-like n=1 Tax=Lytechinus pictus TaxID=7653 RepID=UPI0030B9F0E6
MTSQIDELKQLREADGELFEEMKVKRDLELKNKGEAEEKCRKAQEKIEKLQKTLKIKRKKIVKLQQERANLATQEVETSSTVNPRETEARSQQNRSRQETLDNEDLQQQQLQQQRQQQLLQQELQKNRTAHITYDIAEVCFDT